jgi:hypothetical protein
MFQSFLFKHSRTKLWNLRKPVSGHSVSSPIFEASMSGTQVRDIIKELRVQNTFYFLGGIWTPEGTHHIKDERAPCSSLWRSVSWSDTPCVAGRLLPCTETGSELMLPNLQWRGMLRATRHHCKPCWEMEVANPVENKSDSYGLSWYNCCGPTGWVQHYTTV